MGIKKAVWSVAAIFICVFATAFFTQAKNTFAEERVVNLLCWVGWDERDLLEPFENAHDIKVNYKTFVSDDAMFSLVLASPGTYDLVVSGPEYVEKLYQAGKLAQLDANDYDFSQYFDRFKNFPFTRYDGDLYAVMMRWGVNGLLYNTDHLTPEDVASYEILWDPKVKGKIGIWDWYLPSMGVISRYLGNSEPYQISDEQFADLREKVLELRPQVKAIHPSPPEMLAALANEETWLVPAAGEWVAAILRTQGKPIDWLVPKEGGVMWSSALVILKDAPHPEMAKIFIQWAQSPEAQALLAQRQAYHSNVVNAKAYELMSEELKDTLKVHNTEEATGILNQISVRTIPQGQPEAEWQDAWEQFKTAGQ